MPRPRLPFARRRANRSAAESQPEEHGARAQDSSAEPQPPQAPQASATSQARQTPQASATPQARADPQERIDGLRAWVAQVDRKLGVRTYVGAAIAVLALAAAAVGLVLTLSLKQDAATKEDIQSLRDQISGVEQSASQAAENSVQALDQRLTDLEDEVNRISTRQTTSRRELKVVQNDIKELRTQVSRARSTQSGGTQASQP
jgi:hypothetical protein